ncbi:putative WSC domain-containing protein [Seiridium cardinale]|uniref:WSC domain-containing protein n=1 Tax=Seiridium cardinale TaxID=138064 RepID=A0ABR2Y2A1_9PEZI
MRSFIFPQAILAVVLSAQSTIAETWEGVPTVGKVVNGTQFMGCPVEIPGRVLTGPSYSDDSMTIESCAAYCVKNNLPLFGVEYGRECYCGKYIPPIVVMPGNAADCNMNCKNNKPAATKQMCGGVNRMSVFNVTTFAGPTALKTSTDWTYQSCFMEPQWGRALSNLVKADDAMTINMCLDACKNANYQFAGLEYGRECWCGATRAQNLEDASDPSCAMQCDMPCGGNNAQMCGGRGAISLYTRRTTKRGHVADGNDYHDLGHGPGKGDIDVAARKGRFLRVRRPAARREQPREEE